VGGRPLAGVLWARFWFEGRLPPWVRGLFGAEPLGDELEALGFGC
jgi:hypothetical protein